MATITRTVKQGNAKGSADLATRLARFREVGIILILLLIVAGATAVEPRFLQPFNMRSILLWVPLLTVVAMGEMMVIIIGGIDVSVGSTLALAGMTVGMIWRQDSTFDIYTSTGLAILIGLAAGALNGALISWAKIPPVITTLGTLSAYRGLTFIVSGGRQIDPNYVPRELIFWSIKGPFGIDLVPWVVIIAAVVAVLTWLFLRYTKPGRNIYAVGGNRDAAQLRGVPVEWTTFFVYTITGALAGLAGVLYASRFGFVNPGETGVGFELTVIAAVVIGGTNVFGGSGSVLGVVLGCLLLGTINVALAVLGIAATWQNAVYGFVILLAVVADAIIQSELRRASTGE
jgi:rhamnose transport system permease protein